MSTLMTNDEKATNLLNMRLPEAQKTKEYKIFSYLPQNRPITRFHVQELVASYEANPVLVPLRPLLVNERMEIIDGQHRFEACKALGFPVFYIIVPHLDVATAQLMNALQRPWAMSDFLNSYADSGREEYQFFRKCLEEYHIAPTALTRYITGGDRQRSGRDFRLGNFKITQDRAEIIRQLDMLSDFADIAPWFGKKPFATAVWKTIKRLGENYDHPRLLAGYEAFGPVRRSTDIDYLRDFEKAYNFGPNNKRRPIRLFD